MEAIHQEEYKGYTIKIVQDDNPDDPREWDNAGKMVTWHSRYTLGDEQPRVSPTEYFDELLKSELEYDSPKWHAVDDMTREEVMDALDEFYIILPLYLYDHSMLSISTRSFIGRAQHAEWDSGQVGVILISKKDAVKEWGKKRFTKNVEKRAIDYLKATVDTYDDYLRGNVYGYEITDPEGDDIDSCYGYYPSHTLGEEGYNDILTEARLIVDSQIEENKNLVALAQVLEN